MLSKEVFDFVNTTQGVAPRNEFNCNFSNGSVLNTDFAKHVSLLFLLANTHFLPAGDEDEDNANKLGVSLLRGALQRQG